MPKKLTQAEYEKAQQLLTESLKIKITNFNMTTYEGYQEFRRAMKPVWECQAFLQEICKFGITRSVNISTGIESFHDFYNPDGSVKK